MHFDTMQATSGVAAASWRIVGHEYDTLNVGESSGRLARLS